MNKLIPVEWRNERVLTYKQDGVLNGEIPSTSPSTAPSPELAAVLPPDSPAREKILIKAAYLVVGKKF